MEPPTAVPTEVPPAGPIHQYVLLFSDCFCFHAAGDNGAAGSSSSALAEPPAKASGEGSAASPGLFIAIYRPGESTKCQHEQFNGRWPVAIELGTPHEELELKHKVRSPRSLEVLLSRIPPDYLLSAKIHSYIGFTARGPREPYVARRVRLLILESWRISIFIHMYQI